MYRVFLKKVLHKREENARKNEDDISKRYKFGASTTAIKCLFLHKNNF